MLKFLGKKIRAIFKGQVNEEMIEELEQVFYESDLGSSTSEELTEYIRKMIKKKSSKEELLAAIKQELLKELLQISSPSFENTPLHVVLIVGTNGNGKTTTTAKLAYDYQKKGKKVLIAATDTFRAAGMQQIEKWVAKIKCGIVSGRPGGDPAAIVFDAIEAAKSRQYDLLLIDTAGRLHTKNNLMKELQKISRVCEKSLPGSPHETLLVLDATIGQNGLNQARIFHQFTPLTGLILTKLDGSAKGGAVIAIQKKLALPVKYIGLGETIDAFASFDPEQFVEMLFE
ncbi:MAG: signal recognition particle-docking protein FtsY [Chlamydiales bacterium]